MSCAVPRAWRAGLTAAQSVVMAGERGWAGLERSGLRHRAAVGRVLVAYRPEASPLAGPQRCRSDRDWGRISTRTPITAPAGSSPATTPFSRAATQTRQIGPPRPHSALGG